MTTFKHWLLDYAEGFGTATAVLSVVIARVVSAKEKILAQMEARAKAAEAKKK